MTSSTSSEKDHRLWAMGVLGEAEFPDHRQKLRAIHVLACKAARPGVSITEAAGCSAAAKGNYRLLENPRVKPDHLWSPLHNHTAKQLQQFDRVLAIQDGTVLMFPTLHATEGLGTVDTPLESALHMHSGLIVSLQGQVLGLICTQVWARPPEEFHKALLRNRPLQEKESYKWITAALQMDDLRRQLSPQTSLLHICDREGDIHELLQCLLDLPQDDFIIRSNQDRSVQSPQKHLRATMQVQPLLDSYWIEVLRQHGKPRRQAKVELRVASVTLQPPRQYTERRPITFNVVWLWEPDPADEKDRLDWMLLSTLPIGTPEQAREVIELYRQRWLIEELHLTLKRGCRIEQVQLKTAERIEKQLAICSAVALRVLQLRQLSRTDPEAPCTVVLSQEQWHVLWMHVRQQRPAPDQPPRPIRQAVLWIGALGGHLGRKCDGMPGVRTLWRGWRNLQLMIQGYRLSRDH